MPAHPTIPFPPPRTIGVFAYMEGIVDSVPNGTLVNEVSATQLLHLKLHHSRQQKEGQQVSPASEQDRSMEQAFSCIKFHTAHGAGPGGHSWAQQVHACSLTGNCSENA
jgi:hypothetical protein